MKRKLMIVSAVAVGLLIGGMGYASSNIDPDKVKTEVKVVDDGLNISVTSKDQSTVEELKKNSNRFLRMLNHWLGNFWGFDCPYESKEDGKKWRKYDHNDCDMKEYHNMCHSHRNGC